jgi:hypothetical protein
MWSLLTLVSLILLLLPPPAERPPWEIIRATDGDFAFSMPVLPNSRTESAASADGPVETISYTCSSGGSQYLLRRARKLKPVDDAQVIGQLDEARKAYFREEATLVKETKVSLDGVPGDDFTYSIRSPQGEETVSRRTRHYIKGRYYYELTVSSRPGLPLPDDTTRFLSSLTFEALVRANQALVRSRPGPAAPTRGSSGRPATRPRSEAPKSSIGVDLVDGTPEEALKTFMVALAAKDERVLRAITLPDDGFEWLLKDRPAPLTGELLRKMKERLEQTPFHRLKAGDRVKMPGGRAGVIQSADVRTGRVVLRPAGSPYPTRLENVEGHWKVFARPFIVARQTAEAELSKSQKGSRFNGPERQSPKE